MIAGRSWWGFGWFVEGDAELDGYVPAGDADLVDDQAEQLLTLVEVELVDDGEDVVGESGDAVADLVVAGQVLALAGEAVAALLEVLPAGVGVGGAAL